MPDCRRGRYDKKLNTAGRLFGGHKISNLGLSNKFSGLSLMLILLVTLTVFAASGLVFLVKLGMSRK